MFRTRSSTLGAGIVPVRPTNELTLNVALTRLVKYAKRNITPAGMHVGDLVTVHSLVGKKANLNGVRGEVTGKTAGLLGDVWYGNFAIILGTISHAFISTMAPPQPPPHAV